MSKVTTIKKALRTEALLKDCFTDIPGVRISVHAVEDRAIKVEASYHGSDDYEVTSGDATYSAEHPSTGVGYRDLWKHALHPLDHWVDIQLQVEQAAKDGLL